MAQINAKPTVSLVVNFTISEAEARALDALAGYGEDEFIKHFYGFLGKHYMEPHEAGLRLFLKSIRDFMPGLLARADEARKSFETKDGKR